MALYRLNDHVPAVPPSAYVAAEATVIGQVVLGENATVWSGAVIRGDNEGITVGDGSNVQEGAVLHADPGFPLTVGTGVTIGHQAMLHGCTVGDGSLIGIQAVVMNGAVIGKHCIVGAGALVTEGKQYPDRTMILGAPAKAVREIDDAGVARLEESAASYVRRGLLFRTGLERIG